MAIDHLKDVPNDWLEANIDRLATIYDKINSFYWVGWRGGYEWRFQVEKPLRTRNNMSTDWKRPSLAQIAERQYLFENPPPKR